MGDFRLFPHWALWFGRTVDNGQVNIYRRRRQRLRFEASAEFVTADAGYRDDELTPTECARLVLRDVGLHRKVHPVCVGPSHFRWRLNEEALTVVLPVVNPFLNRQAGQAKRAQALIDWKKQNGPIPRTLRDMDYLMGLWEQCQALNHAADPLFAA